MNAPVGGWVVECGGAHRLGEAELVTGGGDALRRGLSHCDDGFCERVVESPPGFGRRLRWFADFISVDCTAGRHPFRGCWPPAAPLLSDQTVR